MMGNYNYYAVVVLTFWTLCVGAEMLAFRQSDTLGIVVGLILNALIYTAGYIANRKS